MISVNPRARRHTDAAGDPFDGLVNMFDLGVVLAVGFLLAALSALHLEHTITDRGLDPDTITVDPTDTTGDVPPDGTRVIGRGEQVGRVYRLADGRLIYVVSK